MVMSNAPAAQPAARGQDNSAQAAARAALMQKLSGVNAQPAPIEVTPPGTMAQSPSNNTMNSAALPPQNKPATMFKPAPVQPVNPVTAPVVNPMAPPPPLPISASKEAQLQSLLQQYDSNQITPAQYQAERAKILAEP